MTENLKAQAEVVAAAGDTPEKEVDASKSTTKGRAKKREKRPKKLGPKKRSSTDATYSVPEAGALVGLGRNGSYDAARRGELPTLKFGRLLRVPKIAMDRLLASAGRGEH